MADDDEVNLSSDEEYQEKNKKVCDLIFVVYWNTSVESPYLSHLSL